MRGACLLFWCCSLSAADISQLAKLNRDHRFFELRRALEPPGWNADETVFYRGVIACRFAHENEGIELLRKFLAAHPGSPLTRQAHEEIAGAFERLTRYKDAARELAVALQVTPKDDPERESTENTQALLESFSDVPPQSILFGIDAPVRATRNRIGTWNVPVSINGVTGSWIFDTGANQSTVSRSEARHMGLAVRDSKAWVAGSTGQKNPLQIAVAGALEFGGAQIHDVAFLVLADEALKIAPLHYQISGVLGLPVLRDVGRLGIAKSGEVITRPVASGGAPNLYFEELSPIVEIGHNQQQMQMLLDTGANDSVLYPSFRNALAGPEQSHLRNKREKTAGAGGAVIPRTTAVVPKLGIELYGKSIELKKLSLLPESPSGTGRYRDGVIGMDTLWNGFVLDFSAMRLEPITP
jgi:predicted aspartyl protease